MSADLYTGAAYVQVGDLTITPGSVVDGVLWDLEPVEGWNRPAPVTEGFEQRNADHGGWRRPNYYEPRDLELKGLLNPVTAGWSGLNAAWSTLRAAVPSFDSVTLTVAEPGRPVLQADVVQVGEPITTPGDLGWAFSVPLLAVDPRLYDTDESTDSTGLPITSGGLSLPLTLPLTIGATTSSGMLSGFNAGDVATRPVFTITGPCPAGASLTHDSGRRLYIPEAVPAGSVLTIDTDARTALLDGVALRVVTGSWFEFEPGMNTVQFAASSYDAGATLGVSFRSAWR